MKLFPAPLLAEPPITEAKSMYRGGPDGGEARESNEAANNAAQAENVDSRGGENTLL
jgi:hypothetical protein